MIITPDNLTNDDYRILNFIDKFQPVSETEIIKHFPKINVKYHLDYLSHIKYHNVGGIHFPLENSFYIYKTSKPAFNDVSNESRTDFVYNLSDYGKNVLIEHKSVKAKSLKSFVLKSILIPILVSVLTTLIIYVLQSLLKLIP